MQKYGKFFNAITFSYDRLNHIMSFGIDRLWRRKVVCAIADSEKSLRVLDILPFIGGLISGHKEAYAYLPKSILAFPKENIIVPMLRSVVFSEC